MTNHLKVSLREIFIYENHPTRLLKALVVLGVLLLSVLSALKMGMYLLLIPIGLFIGIVALVMFLKIPAIGLVLFVVGSLFIPSPFTPWGYEYTLNTSVLLVAGLSIIWIMDMFIRKRYIQLVASRLLTPLAAFMVVAFISFISGQIRYYYQFNSAPLDAQIAGLAVFFLSGLAFLLSGNLIDDIRWLERICWIFIAFGAIYVLARLNRNLENLVRPLFQYGSDASGFWIWMVCITGSQALFNTKLHKNKRLLLFFVLLVTLYISVIQFYSWKSGWLPAGIGLAVIIYFGAPKLRIPGILLGLIAVSIYFVDLGTTLTGDEDYSILTRVEAWKIVLEISKANPIFGLGPANYYWYTPLIPILGYSLSFNSHNNYIDIFAQMGAIGFIAFVWFIWVLGILTWRLINNVPEGFPKAYAIGLMGGLAGTLVSGMLGDWFFPFVYNVGLGGFRSSGLGWFFMGGVIVLEKFYLSGQVASAKRTV